MVWTDDGLFKPPEGPYQMLVHWCGHTVASTLPPSRTPSTPLFRPSITPMVLTHFRVVADIRVLPFKHFNMHTIDGY